MIKIWVFETTPKVVSTFKCIGMFPSSIAIDPEGKMLGVIQASKTVFFDSLESQKMIERLTIPIRPVSSFVYDLVGQLWLGDEFGQIIVISSDRTPLLN